MNGKFALATLVGVWLAISGCGLDFDSIVTPTPEKIRLLEESAQLKIPTSSTPLLWRESHGIDMAIWLKMKIPAADLASFFAASPINPKELSSSDSSRIDDFRGFFAAPPKKYRAGQYKLPQAQCLNVLIDEDDPAEKIVYLMWHET
ncbi:hypothetical protein [Blastopirellula retiformator]|uniref:Lipoprotein n=1 Tax=Blastopirellula retiformator TaxID=2527970 RepID=A0A5C5VKL6_9BACT|nr:hypothetical protein [Blastopirellula retiformator]TWT38375.1 hypothetical protein Enr8_00670 [Blastopirellula retiformator]